VKELLFPYDILHNGCDCISTVHQYTPIGNAPTLYGCQHVQHMVYLGLAICVRSEDAVVRQPELVCQWVEVHTVDHPNALEDTMCIATPLRAHQLYFAA